MSKKIQGFIATIIGSVLLYSNALDVVQDGRGIWDYVGILIGAASLFLGYALIMSEDS